MHKVDSLVQKATPVSSPPPLGVRQLSAKTQQRQMAAQVEKQKEQQTLKKSVSRSLLVLTFDSFYSHFFPLEVLDKKHIVGV